MFKKFREKKSFNQTISFALSGDPQSVEVCIGALTDEIKTLILTISTFKLALFHSRVIALFHCQDAATVRNQHQLLTCKTSKWHLLFSLRMKAKAVVNISLHRIFLFMKFKCL